MKILLSEGSSTNVREMITALGPLGYTLDICDPNPFCMGRFSSYIHRVYKCPKSGEEPVAYLKFVIKLIKDQKYDVLFPANEQAFLFSWAMEYLTPIVGLAVSDFSAFKHLQTKSAFMRWLDGIGLPHPRTLYGRTWKEILEAAGHFDKTCYIKTDYGTASSGVWSIGGDKDLNALKVILDDRKILDGQEFLIQEVSQGVFEQLHSIFDHGRLLALHCTRRLKEGLRGGAVIKTGVERPLVRRHLEKLGASLGWHGSLSIDYFFNEANGRVYYIDANPRITEPMNAAVNGINLSDIQIRLSSGGSIRAETGTIVNKSHSAIQAMLGAAGRRFSRFDVLRELFLAAAGRGIYKNSREGVTPVAKDFPSIVPLSVVLFRLLCFPKSGQDIAKFTIDNYSLGPAIPRISGMKPEDFISL